jgi:subtilisin-like proprotein convertase family protein
VDIQHTYVGDLRIDLIGPNDTSIILQSHQGGSEQNVQRTYSEADTPALSAFRGKSLRGTWRLRIVDAWRMDEGTLRSWRVIASTTNAAQPEPAKRRRPEPAHEARVAPAPLSLTAER